MATTNQTKKDKKQQTQPDPGSIPPPDNPGDLGSDEITDAVGSDGANAPVPGLDQTGSLEERFNKLMGVIKAQGEQIEKLTAAKGIQSANPNKPPEAPVPTREQKLEREYRQYVKRGGMGGLGEKKDVKIKPALRKGLTDVQKERYVKVAKALDRKEMGWDFNILDENHCPVP